MAGELLTRDDIERGKLNFNAFERYLNADKSASVSLPSGKQIKSLKGVEETFYGKIPTASAAYRAVGLADDQVMLVGAFGLGRTGVTILPESESIESYSKSGFYRHLAENTQKPSHGGSGDASVTMAYSSTHYSRLHSSLSEGGRLSFVTVKDGVSQGWRDIYHEGNKKPYNTTTATSANVVVTTTGELQRSTSSKIFKKDIEDISIPDYRAALKSVRPVSYRSTEATADRTDWSWYSFIAEELAAIDKRFVQMSPTEFFEDTDEDGKTFINSRELPEGEYAANGINTNGIVALMVHVNQQMLVDIEALESEKTQLKTRMTKLEKRLDALEQPATNSAK
ncbi:MAG: tail fiber domain-containing protein [Psychrobacter alimentarius]